MTDVSQTHGNRTPQGDGTLFSALRHWFREEWPISFCRHGWRWGWKGDGWNMIQLGKVNIHFASGPSPRQRLRKRLGRG